MTIRSGQPPLNHFTLGLLRYQNPDGVPDRGFDPLSQLGLKGTLLSGWFPAVNIDGLSAFGTQQLKHLFHTVPTVVDSFSKVIGSHTLKFGGEYRKSNANFFGGNGAYGGLSFNAAQTSLPYLSGSSGDYSLLGNAIREFPAGPGRAGKLPELGGTLLLPIHRLCLLRAGRFQDQREAHHQLRHAL